MVSFKVTEDRTIVAASYLRYAPVHPYYFDELKMVGGLISARESFRRWKIARKAWDTRRGKQRQLALAFFK